MSKIVYKKEDFISLDELLKQFETGENKGIYVVNTAFEKTEEVEFSEDKSPVSHEGKHIQGAVYISIGDKNNSKMLPAIPPVSIPFNLLKFGGKIEDYLNSESFTGACRQHKIGLLSEEAFDRISKNPSVIAKRQILEKSMDMSMFGATAAKDNLIEKLNKDLESRTDKQFKSISELTPIVNEFCQAGSAESEEDMYKRYLIVEDKLTEYDLRYLVSKCTNSAIRGAAEELLNS